MKITIITPNYPSPYAPERGAFVEQLVTEWNESGCNVSVINPQSLTNHLRGRIRGGHSVPRANKSVCAPRYVSLSNKRIGPIQTVSIARAGFVSAAVRSQKTIGCPDLFYGKFLFMGGAAASVLGEKYERPAFVDLGESRLLETMSERERLKAAKILRCLTGVVCVSDRLKREAIELGVPPHRILVAPNAADPDRFKPIDQRECRRLLGLPLHKKIIAFTGHFIERKGPLRVLAALKAMRRDDVVGVFMGQGPQLPIDDLVVHAAPVRNADLPYWLNAADVFALPTLAEGHCNAINEAISVGLPVATSDIPDIRMQVEGYPNVELIDPMDIEQLAQAIGKSLSVRPRVSPWMDYRRSETVLEWIRHFDSGRIRHL